MNINHTLITLVNNLGVFMIAAQMVIHFCAKQEYEKHISLLIGLIIIVICVVPIMDITQSGFSVEFKNSMKSYEKSLHEALENYEKLSREEVYINLTPYSDKLKADDAIKTEKQITIVNEIKPVQIGED